MHPELVHIFLPANLPFPVEKCHNILNYGNTGLLPLFRAWVKLYIHSTGHGLHPWKPKREDTGRCLQAGYNCQCNCHETLILGTTSCFSSRQKMQIIYLYLFIFSLGFSLCLFFFMSSCSFFNLLVSYFLFSWQKYISLFLMHVNRVFINRYHTQLSYKPIRMNVHFFINICG
jgi:hypothetical protein